jgi:hypothetical protein
MYRPLALCICRSCVCALVFVRYTEDPQCGKRASPRKRGCGGAFRAFVRDRLRGTRGNPQLVMKEVTAEYRAMKADPARLEDYNSIGAWASEMGRGLARRYNGKLATSSFGMKPSTTRLVASAKLKRSRAIAVLRGDGLLSGTSSGNDLSAGASLAERLAQIKSGIRAASGATASSISRQLERLYSFQETIGKADLDAVCGNLESLRPHLHPIPLPSDLGIVLAEYSRVDLDAKVEKAVENLWAASPYSPST